MIPFKSVRQTLFVPNKFSLSRTLYQSSKPETRSVQQARSDCGANPDTLMTYDEPLDENVDQQIQLLPEHFQQTGTDLNQLVGIQETLDRSSVHQRQKRHVIITPRLVPNHPQSRWTSLAASSAPTPLAGWKINYVTLMSRCMRTRNQEMCEDYVSYQVLRD